MYSIHPIHISCAMPLVGLSKCKHVLYLCGLILQVSDLTGRLSSRDREFDAYRQQVLSKPESKLQAELTMIHMEKVSVLHCLVL